MTTYIQTIQDDTGRTLVRRTYKCQRLETAQAQAELDFADYPTARTACIDGRIRHYFFEGVWRNGYHHQKACEAIIEASARAQADHMASEGIIDWTGDL